MIRALWRTLGPRVGRPARRLLAGGMLLVLSTSNALAAGGGKTATKLINVADTRDLEPGFSRWIADLYNGNLIVFGLGVVVVMALQGAVLGLLFDRLIALLGIKLGKIDHHE